MVGCDDEGFADGELVGNVLGLNEGPALGDLEAAADGLEDGDADGRTLARAQCPLGKLAEGVGEDARVIVTRTHQFPRPGHPCASFVIIGVRIVVRSHVSPLSE